MKLDIKDLDYQETKHWVVSQGMDAYRSHQIRHWVFKGLIASFDEMTNLPKSLRAFLKENVTIHPLEIAEVLTSRDGTKKFLFKLADGHLIETVLIPERGHYTLCISSQVGCAMGCRFCFTARQGLKRNLKSSEIVEQVIQVKRSMDMPDRLTNIVLMGMGEPLDNYEPVVKAIGNLIQSDGMSFSHRKVTLSTCGLIPQLRRLGEDITVNLAISLNAADDEIRSRIMPINRKYPLSKLISACRRFPLPNRRMITFEYILIKGINDRDEDAYKLCQLLSTVRAKINLIPLNANPSLTLFPSSMERTLHFQQILIKNHYTVIIRKSKGSDILAACGQLSGKYSTAHPN